MPENIHEVVVVGGGVTGTALAYTLARYTNVRRIVLLEKNPAVAMVNSHPMNNAQTSHDGGTETNYNLTHALEVKRAATALRSYVKQRKAEGLFKRTHRMVLGVGEAECTALEQRYEAFRMHYPDLRLVGADELAVIEPKLMEGRNPDEPVVALVSEDGYAIDYQKLAECFVEDALTINPAIAVRYNTQVKSVWREDGVFVLETTTGMIRARVAVFAAGAYSLLFAQELGYGKQYAILPVAGSFFSGGKLLRGKVYRVQIEGMPFAAIHGDPDVLNQDDTRFGPTTKPLPLMERHRYKTFLDFIRLPLVSVKGLLVLLGILANKRMLGYVFRNTLYDIPVLGKLLFLREARAIVPSIRYRDLHLRRGVGGIRPQIVNMDTGALEMGDKTIHEDCAIFNTTPSPGASVCLANAERDAARVVGFLGEGYQFDKARLEDDLDLLAS